MEEYKKLGFDSHEELIFSWYLQELKEARYVHSWVHHPESYILSPAQRYTYRKELKTKTKLIEITLLREHKYTADFHIDWGEKAVGVFFNTSFSKKDLRKFPFIVNSDGFNWFSVIEVKPVFSMYNSQREFALNQKWLYFKHEIYAQKIIALNPKKTGLFQTTFTPYKFLYTPKTKKLKNLNYKVRTLQEFVQEKIKKKENT